MRDMLPLMKRPAYLSRHLSDIHIRWFYCSFKRGILSAFYDFSKI